VKPAVASEILNAPHAKDWQQVASIVMPRIEWTREEDLVR